MAGELVWDNDIQRYVGTPELVPAPKVFDPTVWLAGLTQGQRTRLAVNYMRNRYANPPWSIRPYRRDEPSADHDEPTHPPALP